jgi:hypothetical protein
VTTDTSSKCNVDPEIPDVCEICDETADMCDVDLEADPSCMPVEAGCRITGGGITSLGETDPERLASVAWASFGGQVGAPCGCIGCFDDYDHVQGQWTHVRHKGQGRLRAPHFASLICGCDGVFDGHLCNPGDRDPGPEPRPAPANMACWTGFGQFGHKDAVFRTEVEDRGEPSTGKNSGPSEDVYRMQIWVVKANESASALLDKICCRNAEPLARTPDVSDGGNLGHGNIQIHPPTPLTDRGICPPPSGTCRD